jgi:putative acetyltransferase
MSGAPAYRILDGRPEDRAAIAALYRATSAAAGGLARQPGEITDDYVEGFTGAALERGILLVARDAASDALLGEVHAYPPGPAVFAHVLGELTIAVHPAQHGRGIGRALMRALLQRVIEARPDILRVELVARESNRRAIALYERLGFRKEGRLEARIRGVGGGIEADIPMGWVRAAGMPRG